MKKIGILCAGDAELEPFLPHIENGTVIRKAMLNCYDGEICGVPVLSLIHILLVLERRRNNGIAWVAVLLSLLALALLLAVIVALF